MTKVDRKLMNPSEYARHRGCTRQAVGRALREGRISTTPEGLIDPVAADAQWAAHSRPRVRSRPPADTSAPPASDGDRISYDEARRRQAIADMLQAERDELLQRGRLVWVDSVRDATARKLTAARQILLDASARLTPLLAATSDPAEIARLLDEEHHRALDHMARQEIEQ